jgi:hypothetical protein
LDKNNIKLGVYQWIRGYRNQVENDKRPDPSWILLINQELSAQLRWMEVEQKIRKQVTGEWKGKISKLK